MQVILIIGAAQALFFSFLLFNRKERKLHDKILAVWLGVLALHLSFAYWLFLQRATYVQYVGSDAGVIILYYALMYLYARVIIHREERFRLKWLLHIIPCVLVYEAMLPFILLDMDEKTMLFRHNLSPILFVGLLLTILFVAFYVVSIFRMINRHALNIKKTFSFDDSINLLWLKRLALVLAGIWLCFTVAIAYVYYLSLMGEDGSIHLYSSLDLFGYSLFTLFVYLLGYFGYKQGSIFTHQPVALEASDNPADGAVPRPAPMIFQESPELRAPRDENLAQDKAFVQKLQTWMETQKPYLNSTLSLPQLAADLQVSSHYLSGILNTYLHKNFYEYINHFRVDEVKRKIMAGENAHYTLLAIAMDCGFNSKATFNRIFKNYTGYTPSQFQQEFAPVR